MGEDLRVLEATLRGEMEGRAGVVCEAVREPEGIAMYCQQARCVPCLEGRYEVVEPVCHN